MPSLFRSPKRLEQLTKRAVTNHPGLLLAERDLLIHFFEIADKRGLNLPDDSQQLRATLETLSSERGDHSVSGTFFHDSWQITEQALSLTALAQHYGLPTRLLDWSRQSFVAAFFAAESAIIPSQSNQLPMVVWAFNFPKMGRHDKIDFNAPVRVVTAPSASNPNLKAQQGLFTLLHERFCRDVAPPSFDEFLNQWGGHEPLKDCQLLKFTLCASGAFELLRLLAKLDITPSKIYPGYHSILRDMEMESNWQ